MEILADTFYSLTDPEGWMDIFRVGEFPTSSGNKYFTQVVTEQDLHDIVRKWIDEGRREFVVDADHLMYDQGHDTRALGWGKDLRAVGGILQARVRLTEEGRKLIDGGIYRQTSIVVNTREEPNQPKDAGNGPDNPLRVRAWRIDSFALTNRPNIPGLRMISHRRENGGGEPQKPTTTKAKRMEHKDITALLGLPDSATDDQVRASVTTFKNRAAEADGAKADAVLAMHANRIPAGMEGIIKNQLIADYDNTLKTIQGMSVIAQAQSTGTAPGGFHTSHRSAGDGKGAPGAPPVEERKLTPEERHSQQMSFLASVRSRPGMQGATMDVAFNTACGERPDLFTPIAPPRPALGV